MDAIFLLGILAGTLVAFYIGYRVGLDHAHRPPQVIPYTPENVERLKRRSES